MISLTKVLCLYFKQKLKILLFITLHCCQTKRSKTSLKNCIITSCFVLITFLKILRELKSVLSTPSSSAKARQISIPNIDFANPEIDKDEESTISNEELFKIPNVFGNA